MDELSADFARVNQQLIQQQDKIKTLEEEVSTELELLESSKGKTQGTHKEKLTTAQAQLAKEQGECSRLVMYKDRILKLLADAQPSAVKPIPQVDIPAATPRNTSTDRNTSTPAKSPAPNPSPAKGKKKKAVKI